MAGGPTTVPPFPLRGLGLAPDVIEKCHGKPGALAWRDESFQMGRAPFDSKFCAVWRALFQSFAPAERALGLVFPSLSAHAAPAHEESKTRIPRKRTVWHCVRCR